MLWVDTANTVQNHQPNNGNSKQSNPTATSTKQPPIINCKTASSTNQTAILHPLINKQQQQLIAPCGVRIERADMDGSKRSVLLNTQLGYPIGLTTVHLGTSSSYQYSSYASLLNKQTEDVCSLKHLKVIFVDSKLRTLEMVDLDG